MNELIPLMVIFPIAAALLINLFGFKSTFVKYISIIVAFIIPIIPLASNFGLHYFGGHAPLESSLSGILYHTAITYSFTAFEQLFIFILGILGFFVVLIYVNSYKKASGPYLFLLFMGIAAVSALILSDDIFHMFVFFEIAAIVQVGIVAASTIKDRYEIALKYMIVGSIGSPIILLGIAFLLAIFGNVNITDIVNMINAGFPAASSPVFFASLALIFFGWLYTAGLPPFHTAKSGIYSGAEPQGAALLQAFSVITMVSILIAMVRIFSGLEIFNVILVAFSLLAMILSITMALVQTDFKRMIAFLAVGELGFIGLGMGIGTELSMTAGLFQAVNEMVITALLFIGFGAIAVVCKTTDINKLGGLISDYPKTAIMVLIGGFAMAGVPPLNGFQSKLMLVQSALNAGYPEFAIIIVLISIATFVVFVKVFYLMFLKTKPKALEVSGEKIPKSTIITLAVFLIICITLGLFPSIATDTISGFVGGLL
jgi:energy-converting hydrogenase B subunit F